MSTSARIYFAVLVVFSFAGWVVSDILPSLEYPVRLLAVAADGLVVLSGAACLFRSGTMPAKKYMVLFVLASFATLAVNYEQIGIVTHLNGLRYPLVFFSSLLILNDVYRSEYRALFEKNVTWFLAAYAIVQTPVALNQFLVYGAGDMVSGTFGHPGGSGYLTQLLFLTSFYFIAKDNCRSGDDALSAKRIVLSSLFLFPCAINETKISFVYLLIYVILLAPKTMSLLKVAPVVFVGGVLFYGLYTLYSHSVEDPANYLDRRFLERYLLHAPEQGVNVDVPRFEKLTIMFRMYGGDSLSWLFGRGYGLFGGRNILGTTLFARSIEYMVTGTRNLLFSLWIQGGLVAVALAALVQYKSLRLSRAISFGVSRFRLFLGAVLASIWVYNDAVLDRTVAMMLSFFLVWAANAESEDSSGDVDAQSLTDVSKTR